jgi:hypothetical protein
MAKKEIITPIGVFKYAHLNKPDTKFNADGEYKVTLILDKDEDSTKALIKKLDALHKEAFEAGVEQFEEANGKAKAAWKKKGITEPVLNDYYDDEVDDEGNPTGNIELKFKTKAQFKDRKTGEMKKKTVPLIDGKGQTIPTKKRPLVYGGTEGRIAFATNAAFIPKGADVYLGLYINSVQITKLVSGGGGANPFGAVEGSGFSSDELEEYEGGASDDDLEDDVDDDEGDLDDEIPF